ncbi:MAG: tetratricopeptide repeat protein [Verrucomicrobiales bacterium]|nr:tetratricopeptide repeat protein [Verrucomicrobiota bacterium JB025]
MTTTHPIWRIAVLALVALALYGRVAEFGFVNYDDNRYFTENPQVLSGLGASNAGWAFEIHGPSMWIPLTWLSHQAMVTGFGTGPAAHHVLNSLLHSANTALLFILLLRLTGSNRRSFAVALLFAIHPIHVESVAWVTERKDVLSLFFCLLALICYEAHARKGGWRWFPAVVLCHSLAVMAKPLAVTLPCVMLVLDFWPLGRWKSSVRILLEKLPLLAISAVACWLTVLCQLSIHAIGSTADYPLATRAGNAVVAYAIYLRRLFVPTDLAVFYPYPTAMPAAAILALALLTAISISAWMLRRSVPAVLTGWLWFLGTLVPMIGIVQAGAAQMADRYAYFSFIGLYIALVWGTAACVRDRPKLRMAVTPVAAIWLLALAGLGIRQIGFWRDSLTLFQRTVDVTEGNYLAHNNLGLALRDAGRTADAELAYQRSLDTRPSYTEARNNLGILFATTGRREQARAQLEQVVAADPHHAVAWHNLGKVNADLGDSRRAEICFRKAIELAPDFPMPRYDLGTMFLNINRNREAVEILENLTSRSPGFSDAWVNLGIAQSNLGNPARAEHAYLEAHRLGSEKGRANLVSLLLAQHRITEAAALANASGKPAAKREFATSLRIAGHLAEARNILEQLVTAHPADADLHNDLGHVVGMQGDHAAALAHFRHALMLDPNHAAAARNVKQAEKALASP